MELRLNDTVMLKKPHPCGESAFLILRVGMDLKLKCKKCGREFLIPRWKAEKMIRSVIREEDNDHVC